MGREEGISSCGEPGPKALNITGIPLDFVGVSVTLQVWQFEDKTEEIMRAMEERLGEQLCVAVW